MIGAIILQGCEDVREKAVRRGILRGAALRGEILVVCLASSAGGPVQALRLLAAGAALARPRRSACRGCFILRKCRTEQHVAVL